MKEQRFERGDLVRKKKKELGVNGMEAYVENTLLR